jgi:hypothetical protein
MQDFCFSGVAGYAIYHRPDYLLLIEIFIERRRAAAVYTVHRAGTQLFKKL